MVITLYLVGYSADEAKRTFAFDTDDSAISYALDHSPPMNIYSVEAKVDFSTAELEYLGENL